MTKSMLLFHWSPRSRRGQILRYGLRPGCWSVDHEWRPPYVCLAEWPSLAWALSGDTARGRAADSTWDLWQTWYDRLAPASVRRRNQEIRVFTRIYKRDIWYVGSRLTR